MIPNCKNTKEEQLFKKLLTYTGTGSESTYKKFTLDWQNYSEFILVASTGTSSVTRCLGTTHIPVGAALSSINVENGGGTHQSIYISNSDTYYCAGIDFLSGGSVRLWSNASRCTAELWVR